MSSSSQANDLSMDEILASIRKIISEDPKSAAPPSAKPVGAGLMPPRSASQIMTGRHGGESIVEATPPGVTPQVVTPPGVTPPVRTSRPALDDDILELLEEDRPPATSAPLGAAAAAMRAVTPASTPQPASPQPSYASAPSRAPLNDMWTPREWSRPGDVSPAHQQTPGRSATQAPSPSPAPSPPPVAFTQSTPAPIPGPIPAAPKVADVTEARLEQAIAALGQSLSQPRASAPAADEPQKPIVVSSAPITTPTGGPRIDVVAVVNAATRAALAQRSADEQTSAAAFAMPAVTGSAPSPGAAKEDVSDTPRPQRGVSPLASSMAPSPPVVDAAPKDAAVPMPARAAQPMVPSADQSATPSTSERAPAGALSAAKQPAMPEETRISAAAKLPQAPNASVVAPPAPVASATDVSSPSPSARAVVAAPVVSAPPAFVDTGAPSQNTPAQGVQTLEDTVARLLRPMLRQWLDDNMPRIVERAFKEELAAHDAPTRPLSKPN